MNLENQKNVQGNEAVNAQNPIVIADDRDRTIRQYVVPLVNELNPRIRRPEIEALQFELKPVMFQMLQTIATTTEATLRLKLFPYSLRDRARAWLNSLPSNSIFTWQELVESFLLETFYNGLNAHTRLVVDASVDGSLLLKYYNEAYEIIEIAIKVEDEPPKKEENQPTIEIPTSEKSDSTNYKEIKSKQVNSDKLIPLLDANILPRKSCPLPPKLKGLGSFTITCKIGESYYGKALCDLGSSINLIPTSVFRRLGIGKARLTTFTLQLADQSLAYLEGKIENVLKSELTMRVQDEQVTFNVLKAIRSPDEVKYCFAVSKEDSLVLAKLEYNEPLKGISSDSPHQDEDGTCLEANSKGFSSKVQFKSLELSSHEYKQPKTSREELLELDLIVLKRLLDTGKGFVEGQKSLI
ncbi:gag-asp_proteas domain-containing protein [Gossypium australe]|uniref:Gag-asp_proteas domain-containing protein n=1 Tax=Gossypium australe TaxID=47621 RepID=A0A5B6WI95_9ROSI|nr:gag-asp_proteas domain-containing protein [Gossypium australe]